ncbi:hypothetical protein LZ31DRAFT_206320 [Colletotrichum somersetense]|nr:hypothetical protein LZ31DRAFT_206320 [Colletotrichum somersetense]
MRHPSAAATEQFEWRQARDAGTDGIVVVLHCTVYIVRVVCVSQRGRMGTLGNKLQIELNGPTAHTELGGWLGRQSLIDCPQGPGLVWRRCRLIQMVRLPCLSLRPFGSQTKWRRRKGK